MKTKLLLLAFLFSAFTTCSLSSFAQVIFPDSTFNSVGYGWYEFDGYDVGHCMALQPDGKIVVTGHVSSSDSGSYLLLLMRLEPGGTLDQSFGINGFVHVVTENVSSGAGSSVVLQPDGKIITTGRHFNGNDKDFTLLRFNPDGSTDNSFGNSGEIIFDLGFTEVANVIELQPDGKIICSATVMDDAAEETYSLIVRINADGSLDNTFGVNGITTLHGIYQDTYKHSLILLPDGKIVLGGLTRLFANSTDDTDIYLVKLNQDGSLDVSFGTDGFALADYYEGLESIHAMRVLPDGEFLALVGGCGNLFEINLYNFSKDGSMDTTWGVNGVLSQNIGGVSFGPVNFIIKPDGKILLCGRAYINMDDFCIVQLNQDGSVDEDFGNAGHYSTDLNNGKIDLADDLLLQPDGKIVVGGTSFLNPDGNFAVARYLAEFGVGVIDFSASGNAAWIYPNPIDQNATLQYELKNEEQISIQLLNTEGRVLKIFVENELQQAGKYQQSIVMPENLPSGSYFILISSPTGQVSVKVVW